jgi:hypothetical protein
MPNNFKATTLQAVGGANTGRILFKRPTAIPWDQMDLTFSPQLGQSIKIRETYQITVLSNGKTTVYGNSNRYLRTTNIGHFQHLYVDDSGEYLIEREGQMNPPFIDSSSTLFTHTSSYEWEYHIYRDYKDFRGAFYGSVDACNADLEPAAVPNGFITEANVIDYVKLTAKLAGKDWIGVLQDVISLTKTTTNGFRFPDKKNLFTTQNQILVVDLETYSLPTAIGDLGVWINPGFSLVGCSHTIECREFGKIEKLSNQLTPASCTYLPGVVLPFPSAGNCADLLLQTLAGYKATYGNEFAYASQGELYNYASQNSLVEFVDYTINAIPWTCPLDENFSNVFYILVLGGGTEPGGGGGN